MTDPRGPYWRRSQNGHHCRHPDCKEIVAGRLWGCRKHWELVPMELRDAWMAAGKPGPRGGILPLGPAAEAVHNEIELWLMGDY